MARVAEVARAALAQGSPRYDCPTYFAALDAALESESPAFGTAEYCDVFRAAAVDPQWLATSLITNAEREGDGATRLWSMAACSTEQELTDLLKRHAVDESRHSLAYLALLDLIFPGSVEPEFREELNQLSPRYAVDQEPVALEGSPYARAPSIDDFVQMNIAEIRTTIHHLMQRAALVEHCPAETAARAVAVLDMLLRDELRHVAYTADLIERRGGARVQVNALFSRRMRDFNDITRCELESRVFD
jgi:tRNA isopentenyl-2-thiomethyl-A-37 hydroxylase MiaE